MFWRSVDLTGNQTAYLADVARESFWRSVDLTGNQTPYTDKAHFLCFGAVSI